ncbi:carboxyl transferase domain-containing protein [Pseudooceanicola sp. LIPI14-2-Ac024]|uniref:acetyl-CoA carboxylase family protein n=1 Tax=Pseudooceanicola sp. LIPI14-2-Ac024 TaxID=3344875 RepID=UPI0035CF2BCF
MADIHGTGTGVLIANRGEIAIRIAQAVQSLGLRAVMIHPEDDANALHTRAGDAVEVIPGRGTAAYLDSAAIVAAAERAGCALVHPGYGFLSENAGFAAACEAAGLTFIGPRPETLDLLGDKQRARALAQSLGVPVLPATKGAASLLEAQQFFTEHPAGIMVKAVAGGGGRGMRPVTDPDALSAAWERCASEALSAFGDGSLYAEALLPRVRHIEVQILGDGKGDVVHVWDRDCSLQRRRQKVVEIAPALSVPEESRKQMRQDAVAMARETGYRGLATFEFLVETGTYKYHFIEANPRIQVEHTVTEAVTGIDLVRAQISVCMGHGLAELHLTQDQIPVPRGVAIQARINAEEMRADGTAHPSHGTIETWEPPSGPNVRLDGAGYRGLAPSPHYDSLLAKLIVSDPAPALQPALTALHRALCAFRVEGLKTNIPFLQNLVTLPEVVADDLWTGLVDAMAPRLAAPGDHPARHFTAEARARTVEVVAGPDGTDPLPCPLTGILSSLRVQPGDRVAAGQVVAILEAMKMEHEITAPASGIVRAVAETGEVIPEGAALMFLEPAEVDAAAAGAEIARDPDEVRPDLAEAIARHAVTLDENRPEAVKRRHDKGYRTARENIADLVDEGTFSEYGALATGARRSLHDPDDLRRITPADGIVGGTAQVNGHLFAPDKSRCMVMSYDYTVLAGTQGHIGHKKTDRLLELAEKAELPIVIYAEGGGGRPGDVDNTLSAALVTPTFWRFGRMSGVAPLVGIVQGRCFAGNASVLGCCDVIISTRDASIGMSGPAMIEGAGLGTVAPDDIGPASVMHPNGVIDILVDDEAQATAAAKQYLSYFQGPVADWEEPDQRLLRHAVPENRLRAYDVRPLIETLADRDSFLELRRPFGPALVTGLIRIAGRPMGVIANAANVNGGAIDRDEADKAARFMQLCDAHDLPILSLCDTPGFMVGPDAETRANVRHFSRMFITGASLTVPFLTVVLRKAYGLGAMAMAGGSFHYASQLSLSWPSGEFGPMQLEGAVQLGFRRELEAIADPEARQARYKERVTELYEIGKAVNSAPNLGVDDVIDPADTRARLLAALDAMPKVNNAKPGKRPMIDAW